MRILRSLALLLIAVPAFAAGTPQEKDYVQPQPDVQWKTQVRGPDGSFQFRALPDAKRLDKSAIDRLQDFRSNTETCLFIRSYAVKRVDRTDMTVPAGVTTCTPAARFQLRRSAPRK